MTDQHPITPPPELVAQWFLSARAMPVDQWVTDVAIQAARWGADAELDACCEWLVVDDWENVSKHLRAARRPKTPSLATTMDKINTEGSLRIAKWQTYKLQPQPGATADDVLAVLALLNLNVRQDVYELLPEVTRRHFTAEPS